MVKIRQTFNEIKIHPIARFMKMNASYALDLVHGSNVDGLDKVLELLHLLLQLIDGNLERNRD